MITVTQINNDNTETDKKLGWLVIRYEYVA